MKELDLLKDWQKNKDSFEQVSEIEIYRMIHKIIIYCEMDFNHQVFLLWTSLNMIFNADDYLENINNNGFVSYLKLFNYLSYG
jgi:hypothetical protein